MKLLALDSATEACSAALYIDGDVRERFEIAPRQHTQLLLPMAHGLLAEAGIGLSDLDLLAFAEGPGSFTGLRITLGAIQGLAFGLDRPVVGVSTLATLAARSMRLANAQQVAVAMDARMSQIYWGLYGLDAAGHCTALVPDSLRNPGEVQRLEAGPWQLAGSGWQRYSESIAAASGLQLGTLQLELYPHAEDVARLALILADQGKAVSAMQAQPVYLRQEVAEKMRTR
jgi:tRNA threonylcarbamoyladenosine biosynthesis protein TsaB